MTRSFPCQVACISRITRTVSLTQGCLQAEGYDHSFVEPEGISGAYMRAVGQSAKPNLKKVDWESMDWIDLAQIWKTGRLF
jgi:hypothetical protein